MIKRFHEYSLDNEMSFLFNNTNESIIYFKEKLLSIINKLSNKFDINKLIEKLFQYLKDKSLIFKKLAIGALFFGFVINSNYKSNEIDEFISNNTIAQSIMMSDIDMKEAIKNAKIDVMFESYKRRADIYLSQDKWKETPLTGEMFSNGARQAYEKYNILVPVELALAQAQFESHFGTTGRSAKNNPFNVGEYSDRTVLEFDSSEEGVNAYFNLMATDYLNDKTVEQLLKNFVNYNGKRYASGKDYERKIKNQIFYNKKWIDKNI